MPDIVCISPVDGREVVRRAAVFRRRDRGRGRGRARKAQAEWKRVPVAERGRILSQSRRRDAGDARRGRAGARVADGPADPLRRRRTRRLRGARARHDRAGRERACRYRPGAEGRLQALHRARAGRRRADRRAVELSVSDGGEFGGARADGRQRRVAQARRADASGRRPLSDRDGPRGIAEGTVPHADA